MFMPNQKNNSQDSKVSYFMLWFAPFLSTGTGTLLHYSVGLETEPAITMAIALWTALWTRCKDCSVECCMDCSVDMDENMAPGPVGPVGPFSVFFPKHVFSMIGF